MRLKKRILDILKFALFFGVGFVILYLVYQNQNAAFQEQCRIDGVAMEDCSLLKKVLADFRTVRPGWIIALLAAFAISNVSRAARWLLLFHPLGFRPRFSNAFFTTMLMYFANLGLPRVGELIRAGSFARYERIGVEKVIGTVVVERVTDLVSMGLVFGLAFLLEFQRITDLVARLTEGQESILKSPILWALGVLGVASLAAIWFLRRRIQQWSFYKRVENILLGFWQGIQSVGKLRRPGWFIFHSLNIWVMYYLMTYFGFLAFAPTENLGLLAALITFVVGALGIVIPSPGGMGTYHLLVVACLAGLYGIGNGDAFSFANIIFFSINIGSNVLFGIVALIFLPILNRDYHPAPLTTQAAELSD